MNTMNTNHEHLDNEQQLQKFLETLDKKKKAIEKRKNDIVYAKSQLEFLEREKKQIQDELSVFGITEVSEDNINSFLKKLEKEIEDRNDSIAKLFEEMDEVYGK